MDEINTNEQSGNVQVGDINNTPNNQPDNTQIVNNDTKDMTVEVSKQYPELSNIPEVNQKLEEFRKENETQTTEQEQIEIDGVKYTPQQIMEIVKKQQQEQQPSAQETPKESSEPTEEEINTKLERLQNDHYSDSLSMFKRFLSLANPPIKTRINTLTGQQEQYYDYSEPEKAIIKAVTETGDFNEFIQYLNPVDAARFNEEKATLENKYKPLLEDARNQKDKVQFNKTVKENTAKWDTFIAEQCKDNPAAQHFFNFGKNTALFDNDFATQALQKFNESIALIVNKNMLQQQTDAMKRAMMNTNLGGGQSPQGKIFTRQEIKNMSSDDFIKNEHYIFEQMRKGLIK